MGCVILGCACQAEHERDAILENSLFSFGLCQMAGAVSFV